MLFSWSASNSAYVPLLSWKKAQDSVPWNIILLLGGGFAMAKGCEVLIQSPEWIQGNHDNSTALTLFPTLVLSFSIQSFFRSSFNLCIIITPCTGWRMTFDL